MPNPARMHHQSSKMEHFLGLAELYIRFGQPHVYEIEPRVTERYIPDVYTVLNGKHVVIEYQRSIVSQKKMQGKVDSFVRTHNAGRHGSRELWIVSDYRYNIVAPSQFTVKNIPMHEKAPVALS